MRQGLAYFPGINQIVEGSISFAVGVSPSTATLTIAPQLHLTAEIGTLVFFDGETTLQWPNAKLLTNSFERNKSGLVWRLAIVDRRWLWQSSGGGGEISKGANLHYEDNSLIRVTEATLQDLATACLLAMGETDYDVSALPTTERPEVMWDKALPAAVLEDMCGQFGFNVVLGLDNRVRICRVGIGAELPETPDVVTSSGALEIPAIPRRICVVGPPTRYQVDMELEACGIENDRKNTIKAIDDLSYKPDEGWEWADLYGYDCIDNLKERNFALQSVFRYYRVKFPLRVPGFVDSHGNDNSEVQYPWQIRIEDTQCEYVVEDWNISEEQRRCSAAVIGGIFYNEFDGGTGNNVRTFNIAPYQFDPVISYDEQEDAALHNVNWHLGGEMQLGSAKWHYVVFDRPIYSKPSNSEYGIYAPAKLVLRAAITILDPGTFSPVRHYFYRDTEVGNRGEPRYEFYPDLYVWFRYDYELGIVLSNLDMLQERANHYLDGLINQYQTPRPQSITYAGLKYIELDGAIQQISFSVGKSGCATTVSRNSEQLRHVQPLTYRKLMGSVKSGLRENRANRLTLHQYQLRAGTP
ncbi:MAG: hypothetical protein WC378_00320 [Opitutaceae bacterium]|jgi:hypothetical protein